MSFTRRRLPHWVPDGAIVFVTWRLAGSWRKADDQKRSSALPCLLNPEIAGIVADTIQYGETKESYDLFAWVIMPDHVHMIIQPKVPLAGIMRWLKGRTARQANRLLRQTGAPFWQEESFDHWIRTEEEFSDLETYVENNPVKRGLVESPEKWLWSSRSSTPGIRHCSASSPACPAATPSFPRDSAGSAPCAGSTPGSARPSATAALPCACRSC